ncbi:transcription antitermination regulator [Stutzerimonas stutzeri]|uniref:Transcription antitermination regulator n=1 Tax=Stutzerimonas stutzeri TaxID=316 RepID=A0A2N8T4M7_STUST|nr:nitrate regulatory protein [Stutzerimonas stutzeri]MCQ4324213.1 nitrate- and nitrite sensing domain-containing protein [Stutzerimonas stutzeri]PNG09673.1 transcription antitermination regulator [Stutzerimonas stutzeri]
MPGRKMPATLRFMLAARRSELLGLEDLARTCELVTRISQLVHALQKERGYSNIYLGGNAAHQRQQLDRLTLEAQALEREVRQDLERIDLEAVGSADRTRLFTRIAYALHSLDELPALRRRIREHAIGMQDATATLVRLIGGLLAVVFEAADTAADPDITRCLVALFNFMQGKELAGQERALGVAGFASGYFRDDMLERLEQLLEGQQRCFATFERFASPAAQALWLALRGSDIDAQACRLRDVARRTREDAGVDPQLGELWFELHTRRIDAMKEVETRLEQDLLQCCRQSIERIRSDLHSHRRLLDGIADMHAAAEQAKLFSVQASDLDAPPQDGMTAMVTRSILELLQTQTLRLQGLHEELQEARQALEERRLVERAKQQLMRQQGFTESEAYAWLRQAAMNQGLRLEEVAQRLLALDSAQPGSPAPRRPRSKH